MKTLVESIFGDNVTSEVPLNIHVVKDLVLDVFKKHGLKEEDYDYIRRNGIPQTPFYMIDLDNIKLKSQPWFDVTFCIPVGTTDKKTTAIGAAFCIAASRKSDLKNQVILERVDLIYMQDYSISQYRDVSSRNRVFWDLSGWKRHSHLKSNIFTSDNASSLLGYIENFIKIITSALQRDIKNPGKTGILNDYYNYLENLMNEIKKEA